LKALCSSVSSVTFVPSVWNALESSSPVQAS
jgi:hypothetical protein